MWGNTEHTLNDRFIVKVSYELKYQISLLSYEHPEGGRQPVGEEEEWEKVRGIQELPSSSKWR